MKNLYKALAAFQQEIPAIHEGTKGYGYTYADLKTIFKVINPILKKNGLGFTQLLEDSAVKTIVFHCESGESIESVTPIPQAVALKGQNIFQTMGSGITYFRRYSISAILSLVTDVDSDATGEEKQETKQQQPQVSNEQAIEAVAKLNNATDVEELGTVWKEVLTREERLHPDVITEKNKLKAKLK